MADSRTGMKREMSPSNGYNDHTSAKRSRPDTEHTDNAKIFVGGLSLDTNEDSLMHYFSSFGPVKECIVMMNVKTGRSRGFGFVTFMDPGTVQYVISTQPHHLDGKMIDPKRCSPRSERPEKRDDSPKVFVGGLPPTVTQSELERFFSQYGVVTEVIIMFDQERQRPRGFGFIGFEGPDAVDRLVEEHYVTISGKKVEIKRAEPRDVKSRPLISTNYNQNSYGNYNQGPRPYMGQGPRWMGPGQNMGGPNQDWNEYGGQGNWENYSGGDGNWGPPNMGGPQQWGPRPGGPQQYGPGGPQQNYGPAQGGPAQNYGPQQGGPQSYGPPQGGPPQNYGGPPAGGPPQSYGGPPAGGPSQNYGGPPAGGPQSYGGPGGWQSGPMDPQGNYGPTDGSYGPPQQAPAPVPPANPAGGPNNFWAQWNDTSNQAPAPVAKPGADTVQYPMPGAQGAGAGLNQVPGGPAPVRGPYPSYQSQGMNPNAQGWNQQGYGGSSHQPGGFGGNNAGGRFSRPPNPQGGPNKRGGYQQPYRS